MKYCSASIFFVISVFAALTMLSPNLVWASSIEKTFEQAFLIETAERDPENALALYQNIIDDKNADPKIVAKSKLRAGFCLEVLGKSESALALFEAVAAEPSSATASMIEEAKTHSRQLQTKIENERLARQNFELRQATTPVQQTQRVIRLGVAYGVASPDEFAVGFTKDQKVVWTELALNPQKKWSLSANLAFFLSDTETTKSISNTVFNGISVLNAAHTITREQQAAYGGVNLVRGWGSHRFRPSVQAGLGVSFRRMNKIDTTQIPIIVLGAPVQSRIESSIEKWTPILPLGFGLDVQLFSSFSVGLAYKDMMFYDSSDDPAFPHGSQLRQVGVWCVSGQLRW